MHCVRQNATKHKVPSLDTHMQSSQHKQKLETLQTRMKDDTDLQSELITYYTERPEESGSSTHPKQSVYRLQVVQAFMCAGIPLQKVDMLRPLLERAGFALTGANHLTELIPKVEAIELGRLVAELDGQRCSLAFDGTTRLGSAVNIVARFCTEQFHVQQRLVRFITLAKHADGAALAGLI